MYISHGLIDPGSFKISCSYTTSSENCVNKSVAEPTECRRALENHRSEWVGGLTTRYRDGSEVCAALFGRTVLAAIAGSSLPGIPTPLRSQREVNVRMGPTRKVLKPIYKLGQCCPIICRIDASDLSALQLADAKLEAPPC